MSDLQQELADLIRQNLPANCANPKCHQCSNDQQRQSIQNVFVEAIAASILEKFEVRRKEQPQAGNQKPPSPSPREYKRVTYAVDPTCLGVRTTSVYEYREDREKELREQLGEVTQTVYTADLG